MAQRFKRPIGAPADTQELEYVSALMQSDTNSIRRNGSLTALDIRRLLTSRYGLRVSVPRIEATILKELAGSDMTNALGNSTLVDDKSNTEEADEVIESGANLKTVAFRLARTDNTHVPSVRKNPPKVDLVQMTAMLFIPELQKIKKYWDDSKVIVEAVLKIVLEQAGLDPGVELTVEVLRDILLAFNEQVSEEVLEEMVEVCGNDASMRVLNSESFIEALTADVDLYQVERESLPSTHFEDAIVADYHSKHKLADMSSVLAIDKEVNENHKNALKESLRTSHEETNPELEQTWTAPTIDNSVDTYKSLWWAVVQWFALIVTFFAYIAHGLKLSQTLPELQCDSVKFNAFGCQILQAIVTWLAIFVEVAFMGTVFLLLTGLGNSAFGCKSFLSGVFQHIMGIVGTIFCSILAYYFSVNLWIVKTEKSDTAVAAPFYRTSLCLGFILLAFQLTSLMRILVPASRGYKISKFLASGVRKRERHIKMSASFKIDRLLRNALSCHAIDDDDAGLEINKEKAGSDVSKFRGFSEHVRAFASSVVENEAGPLGSAFQRYDIQQYRTEMCGGVFWVWKGILFNRKLITKEGIWLYPRLIVNNMTQWFVFLLILPLWIYFNKLLDKNYDYSDYEGTMYPTPANLKTAIAAGAISALAAAGTLTFVYIPSAVCTTLRFRSGLISSLKDEEFFVYRRCLDETTSLSGSSFWGILATAVVMWSLVGVTALILIWEATRELAKKIFAGVIGFFVTWLIKIGTLQFLRNTWYGAFYRRKPASVNIMNVILECWSLGLSSGYILSRTVKLIMIAIVYVGRIDTPFLAPHVGWILGSVPLDSFPVAFRKDLLIHEAHRHPFIERLAMLYMLKLRNPDEFGRKCCAIWRIIFVRALMPWIQKYRIGRTEMLGSASTHGHISIEDSSQMQALKLENTNLLLEIDMLRQKLSKYEKVQQMSFRTSRRISRSMVDSLQSFAEESEEMLHAPNDIVEKESGTINENEDTIDKDDCNANGGMEVEHHTRDSLLGSHNPQSSSLFYSARAMSASSLDQD